MIKVIGIGNRIMGDDGIALRVLERIKTTLELLRPKIEVIIGETDFIYCLNRIDDNDIAIIVDSTFLGLKPGEVTLISLDQVNKSSKKAVSQHQLSLINMIARYKSSVKVYIIGIEVFNVDLSFSISEKLKTILNDICNDVLSEIQIVLKMIEAGEQNA